MPRLLSSSSFIISQALIFGAPESVPAGSIASTASIVSLSSLISPRTVEPMCITCEKRCICIYFSTCTVPNLLILPISFLPRSTSILCSASSFSSFKSSASSALSSSSVLPLRLVPASGKVCRTPFSSLTSVSGLAPAISPSEPEK